MSDNDIVRAWKDENFRNGLSSEEQAQLPANPAGSIEVSDELLEKVAGGMDEPAATARAWTAGCCNSNTCYITPCISKAVCTIAPAASQ